jgi:hypothetical protein
MGSHNMGHPQAGGQGHPQRPRLTVTAASELAEIRYRGLQIREKARESPQHS